MTASVEPLRDHLRTLGIQPGMVLFVHSAFDQMQPIGLSPFEAATALCELVGDEGTVAMPSFPMRGRSQPYLDLGGTFDVRRTPSQSGIVTEVFRRGRHTVRSVHPTHPVAARGRLATFVTEDHWRSSTPFDEHSPFARLLMSGAFVLKLGTFAAMTFRHLADHRVQDRIPYPIYSDREMIVTTIDAGGAVRQMTTRAHNPRLRVRHSAVMDDVRRLGGVRETQIGSLSVSLIDAQRYVAVYEDGVARGTVTYELSSDAPASPRT